MLKCTFENGSSTTNLRHLVVHALVEQDGKLLLVKRAPPLLEAGKWSVPAGYMERDETAAQCVLRELYEETGWEGEVLSLFRVNSNPFRPGDDRQNVSFDFIVKPLKKTGKPDHESSAIEWIPIEKLLPFDQFAFDHGESLRLYLEYRKKPFPLPLLV